ncbi:MAG: DegT/DnrJ/EryC1/StrS aminotransferase family protein [Spirochaetes bacterium]|nr:DegT/DnrJ/EryC1/StrS aminotransferase family protein [Spirochaetota bacterium]
MEKKLITAFRPTIRRKDLENVLESMIQERLNYGDFAKHFEEKLSIKTDVKHVVAVNSVSNAFSLVLDTLEVNENDEVILPSFAPQVYLNVLLLKKIKPVLIDIEEYNLQPSLEQIKNSITNKTKAVLLIYYFGYYYDPAPYIELFPNVIQDISSVIKCKINETSLAKLTSFSIANFSYKNLITTGDGAAVFSDNKKYFSPLLSFIEKDYHLEYKPRYQCLMSDLNAAMGISQCDSLDKRLNLNEQIAKFYEEAVAKSHGFSFAQEISASRNYSDFCLMVKTSSKETIKYFKKYGIEIKKPFDYTLHQYLNLDNKNFPNTENYYLKSLMIPLYSTLLKKDVEMICKCITSFY